MLSKSWESKADVITKSKDLKTLKMNVLIGILLTHELNKKHDITKREGKKYMSLTLKTVQNDEKIDGVDMTYLTKRFKNLSKKVIS